MPDEDTGGVEPMALVTDELWLPDSRGGRIRIKSSGGVSSRPVARLSDDGLGERPLSSTAAGCLPNIVTANGVTHDGAEAVQAAVSRGRAVPRRGCLWC